MNETSRNQGRAIMAGAILLALSFAIGVLRGSYWAIAIPVAVLTFFVLGLVAWVGHTIATVQVEAEPPAPSAEEEPEPAAESASAPLRDASNS
jgi:hypothetical protein